MGRSRKPKGPLTAAVANQARTAGVPHWARKLPPTASGGGCEGGGRIHPAGSREVSAQLYAHAENRAAPTRQAARLSAAAWPDQTEVPVKRHPLCSRKDSAPRSALPWRIDRGCGDSAAINVRVRRGQSLSRQVMEKPLKHRSRKQQGDRYESETQERIRHAALMPSIPGSTSESYSAAERMVTYYISTARHRSRARGPLPPHKEMAARREIRAGDDRGRRPRQ